MRGGGRLACAIAALTACGSPSGVPAPPPTQPLVTVIGGGVVARVGGDAIPASLVAETAARQRISPRKALGEVVDDAVVALGAAERGLASDRAVAGSIDAVLARQVALRARDAAAAQGLPTDAEVEERTREHWRDVDLPDAMQVIHAVVLRPKPSDAEKDAAGKAVAAAIAAAEASATSADDFEARAKAVPHGAFDVRVERLDPFVADGRMLTKASSYDPAFAAGAAALPAPGATSGVVASPFGWHVIRLLQKWPGKHVPFEERRMMFEEEVKTLRADRTMKATLARLHAGTSVDVANGVDDLLTTAYQKGAASGPPQPEP